MIKIQPVNATLHVIAVISNPARYKSRYALYRAFADHMKASKEVKLWTVETAYGDREFEITQKDNPYHIQLRSPHELWHKENMINIAIQRLPIDWKYAAWIDADIQFARSDWAYETLHQLQHYDFVQLWSHAIDLGPTGQPVYDFPGQQAHVGFAYAYNTGKPRNHGGQPYDFWHPGFAWAATKEALNTTGGLIDGTLGAADHHMATALIGDVDVSVYKYSSDGYKRLLHRWQDRARSLYKNIGYVDGLILHNWHGKKKQRGYVSRWQVLTDNGFDPYTDLIADTQGLYQLTDKKPKLRDDIRKYFRARNEDSVDVD